MKKQKIFFRVYSQNKETITILKGRCKLEDACTAGLLASKGKGAKKKLKKKLTSVSFMYVCVVENGEMLVFFFLFFPNNSLIDNSVSE